MDRDGRRDVPLLGRHVKVNSGAQDLLASLIFRLNFFERVCRIVKHSQISISARGNDLFLPIGFQGRETETSAEAFSRSAFVRSRLTRYSM
jgi:hypothetical protein